MSDSKEKKVKWLSNASKEDVVKIKRTYPSVIEGIPKATALRSSEDLYKDDIIGLYLGVKEDEN